MSDQLMHPRLEVASLGVSLRQARAEVVDDVSFEVRPGKIFAIVGESGSGKTTVGLALLGHARRGLRITGGRIALDGDDVLKMSPARLQAMRGRDIAYVPQDPTSALNPALRIRRQLAEVLSIHGAEKGKGAIEERLVELLQEVRLDQVPRVLDSYPHQVSGGQLQRVAIAMAFACRPKVIVFDEPTTGLDVTTQLHILNMIRELCKSHGVSGIYVSHDLAVVQELADEVAVLYAGRIVEQGSTDEIFLSPAHPYTKALLAASPKLVGEAGGTGIAGLPPKPGERLDGCAFAPRCQHAQAACLSDVPPLSNIGGEGRMVRCVRPGVAAAEVEAIFQETQSNRVVADTAGTEPIISAHGLEAWYGPHPVLADVGFTLSRGKCIAIIGESGSGKTTLARCIIGLHSGWRGSVTYAGNQLAPGMASRPVSAVREMQYVFQNPYTALNPRRKIGQLVEQPLETLASLSRAERARRVTTALEDAAVDPALASRYPDELSGGERQRVAIARALVVEPRLLICDEVTSALDVSVQASITALLERLKEVEQLSLVFITHNIVLARLIADDIMVLQSGRVVEYGAAAEVLDRPQHPYTQTLVRDAPTLRLGVPSPPTRE